MTLPDGTRREAPAAIGVGGVGKVYRAREAKAVAALRGGTG